MPEAPVKPARSHAVELALNRPENARWPQVATDALGDTPRLQHLTTDLLLLARLDATGSRLLDMAELVRGELASRRPRPVSSSPRPSSRSPSSCTAAAAAAAGQPLLARVLDNAERHATSWSPSASTTPRQPRGRPGGPGRRTIQE
ncbi:hypothetical protein ABZ307_16485 [Streptomyces griseorubiginosus]|uniref:hypothetical protein n=1 Tax=Streptomyces griseorubiginosus TaxID=67304 RepID=UPI0033A9F6F3